MRNCDFGKCDTCGTTLKPIWFEEEELREEHGCMFRTGRKRTACSHLVCPCCLKDFAVDGSFDEPWHN